MATNSFGARSNLKVGDASYQIYRLDALPGTDPQRLPYSLRILLENLLRNEDGVTVRAEDIAALAGWNPAEDPSREILFTPARVLLQDFTGVPAVVDLAAMRDAMADLGGDPARINPLMPADLVIDHSIVADIAGVSDAFRRNADLEFERNRERYMFLRWGQQAFDDFRVVPPNTGIVHQVNLEYLAPVVFRDREGRAYPDTLVGTDSHTPMVNGLGVLGWGVGGIEAEAAMLGQPVSLLIPKVVGFKLSGELQEGATATDLVLTVTEMLRRQGVVGKFVEFYGSGVANVPLANRATIGNMSPEYGSTCAIFPIDDETLRYLELTGRPADLIEVVEVYAKEQGLFHDASVEPVYSETLELDLATVEPSLAGPSRPQDRVPLRAAKASFRAELAKYLPGSAEPVNGTPEEASAESFPASDPPADMAGVTGIGSPDTTTHDTNVTDPGTRRSTPMTVKLDDGTAVDLDHGHVVIAAITSCTNTSNPQVMMAAALLAKKAVERGLSAKPWVKTSLAPGSKVVMDYYERSGLLPYLEKLRFFLVGYGCTTCIGNSGPLAPEISAAIDEGVLAVCSVLSGNRNFEGRINPDVRLNYLGSPPLVVAYALAGSIDIDLVNEPLGQGSDGAPVYLRDVWPSSKEIEEVIAEAVVSSMFRDSYRDVFQGDEAWNTLDTPGGDRFAWDAMSTYVRQPPYFRGMSRDLEPVTDVIGSRVLALLGDSVTTDHISPAGVIKLDSPAGRYLVDHGIEPAQFNSYGSRRGNHEVMIRGTFANIRLRNQLVPGVEGGFTRYLPDPDAEAEPIYDVAMRYQQDGIPLVVLAGKEYGSGSSRDWAAKGTALLGVKAVIAESFERIHRSNLIGMGVLPLQFTESDSIASLGLTGLEHFDILDLAGSADVPRTVTVRARGNGETKEFQVVVRIDTPREADYFRHGGILQFALRQILAT